MCDTPSWQKHFALSHTNLPASHLHLTCLHLPFANGQAKYPQWPRLFTLFSWKKWIFGGLLLELKCVCRFATVFEEMDSLTEDLNLIFSATPLPFLSVHKTSFPNPYPLYRLFHHGLYLIFLTPQTILRYLPDRQTESIHRRSYQGQQTPELQARAKCRMRLMLRIKLKAATPVNWGLCRQRKPWRKTKLHKTILAREIGVDLYEATIWRNYRGSAIERGPSWPRYWPHRYHNLTLVHN